MSQTTLEFLVLSAAAPEKKLTAKQKNGSLCRLSGATTDWLGHAYRDESNFELTGLRKNFNLFLSVLFCMLLFQGDALADPFSGDIFIYARFTPCIRQNAGNSPCSFSDDFIFNGRILTTTHFDQMIGISFLNVDLENPKSTDEFLSQLHPWLEAHIQDKFASKMILSHEFYKWLKIYKNSKIQRNAFTENNTSPFVIQWLPSSDQDILKNEMDGYFSKNPFQCRESYEHLTHGWKFIYSRVSLHCFYFQHPLGLILFPNAPNEPELLSIPMLLLNFVFLIALFLVLFLFFKKWRNQFSQDQ